MKISIKDCFNSEGNLKFDPYRMDIENETPTRIAMYELMFDDRGFLNDRIALLDYINRNKTLPVTCDAIGLYHADLFACNTKGSYPTYYYFR